MNPKAFGRWAGSKRPPQPPRESAPAAPSLPPPPAGFMYALHEGFYVLVPTSVAAPADPRVTFGAPSQPGMVPAGMHPAARTLAPEVGGPHQPGRVIPFRPRNSQLVRPLSNSPDPWDARIAQLPDLPANHPAVAALMNEPIDPSIIPVEANVATHVPPPLAPGALDPDGNPVSADAIARSAAVSASYASRVSDLHGQPVSGDDGLGRSSLRTSDQIMPLVASGGDGGAGSDQ
jgi:hypothetical protein